MIRTGEAVVVPTGFSLIRCGINEPVTKIVSSLTCFFCSEARSAGLPANAAPASKLTAMALATPKDGSVFINNLTTDRWPRKLSEEGEIRIPPANLPRANQQTNLFGLILLALRRGLPPFRHSH